MADLTQKISVQAETSPIEALIKALKKMEKVSADLANALPAAADALALFAGAAVAADESSTKAAKSAKNLDKAVGDSGNTKKSTKNLQGYVKTVNDLRNALGKGSKPQNLFGDTQQAANEIKELEGELLKLVNVYRQAFGKDELINEKFDTASAIQELGDLQSKVEGLAQSSNKDLSIDFNIAEGDQELRDFESTLNRVNSIGIRPTNAEVALTNFGDLRLEGNRLVSEVEDIQRQMAKIGPAAADGGQEAINKMGELSRSLAQVQSRAKEVGSELNLGQQQFNRQVGAKNTQLASFGFAEITLDDIFPSSEQQKVAQLNQQINAQVAKSIEEGAIRDSLNSIFRQPSKDGKYLGAQLQVVDDNIINLTSHLPRLRYALYDVSNSATLAGAALLGAVVGATTISANFERSFADVRRTTGVAGDEIGILKDQIIEISKSIPVSFEDLAKIGTLAGQLNISNASVANFTDTVAKFSATTDVTIEAAATAFGRLDQLVDGVDGQFNKLASSILAVGVNSVATESQIIAIAGQISSIANIAGFSADELIGFSSALASVGTRPELSRGTFTRLFTEINQAVSGSTESLTQFADLAGQSSQEFIDAWTAGNGAQQIVGILRGLSVQGAEAELSLRELGITSVRDVPTLLKLSQNIEEVERQLAIAKVGFISGTELTNQYSIISNTLSEKLVVLKNNFTALIATLGSVTGPLTAIVDVAIKVIGVLEDLASNPVAGVIFAIIGAATGLVAIFSVAAGAILRVAANFTGLLTTMVEIRTAIATTQVGVAGLNTSLAATTVVANSASAALGGLATAQTGLTAAAAGSTLATGSGLVVVRNWSKTADVAKNSTVGLGAAFGNLFKDTKLFSGLSKLLRFAGWIGIALTVVGIVDQLGKKFEWWGKSATKAIDDVGPYLEAIKQDTLDFNEATGEAREGFTTFTSTVADANGPLGDYVKLAAAAAEENDVLRTLVDESTGAIKDQTFAIGANTKELIRADVVRKIFEKANSGSFFGDALDNLDARNTQKFVDAISNPAIAGALKESGFDFAEWTNLIATNQSEAADALLKELAPAAQKLADTLRETDAEGYADEIIQLNSVYKFGYGILSEYNELGKDIQLELALLDLTAAATGDSIAGLGDDTEEATARLEALKAAFTGVFGDVEQIDAVYSSLSALDAAILENGNSFDTMGVKGIANLIALQNATITTIDGAELLGLSSTQAIALVYAQLVRSGVEAAQALILVTNAAIGLGVQVPGAEALAAAVASLDQVFAGVGGSAGGAGSAVRTFGELAGDLASSLFDGVNAASATEDAIFALGEAYGEGGKNALYAGEAMQGAIESILQSSGDGESAVANLAALFVKLSNTVGSQSDPSLQALRQTINAVAQEFGVTNAQVENFIKLGGGGLADINLDNFTNGLKNAQKEVRTLLDYASDLEGVFSRAFDIRFSRIQSIDSIAAAWESVSKTIEDARMEIDDLLASQQELSADRSIKEYFLSVATAYGDTLRADTLRQELAALDKQRSDNALAIAKAQQTAGGDLSAQNPGSRENRDALLGLVGDYQGYIAALAESGASQDELRKATERARKEFIAQAVELGYQEDVVMQYAAAFDDVKTAIDNVPRNITVDANVNPALQALNELNASLNKQISAARSLNAELGKPIEVRQKIVIDDVKIVSRSPYLPRTDAQERALFRNRAGVTGYSSGGYTGSGGTMQPAGIVHKGEYVVPQKYVNQSTGLPDANFLAQIQNGVRSFAMGGFVGGGSAMPDSMMVELSPYDRKLLESAGNVQLRVDGKVVASATNRSNFNEARRGSN